MMVLLRPKYVAEIKAIIMKHYIEDILLRRRFNPTILHAVGRKCDAPFTLTEVTTALHSTNSGGTPGLDGLTYEFTRKF
jgi:hypothetical protein